MAQEHDRKQLCVVRSTAALAHSMPSWTKVLKHAACPARASTLSECYNCESRAAAPATRGRRIPPAHFPRHQWATHAASAELRAVPTQRNKMGASWRALLSRRLPALTPTGTVCLASAREAGSRGASSARTRATSSSSVDAARMDILESSPAPARVSCKPGVKPSRLDAVGKKIILLFKTID